MTGSTMLWYRYWIEFRFRLLVVAAYAIWTGIITPEWAKLSPAAANELLGTRLPQSIGPESLNAWVALAGQMSFFTWAIALCLMGNGLRTAFLPRHPSISYTLTLPVSRSRLISTQQALNCASALIAAALTLAVRFAAMWLRGDRIPFVPLGVTIALATLFVIAWNTFLSALSMVIHELWSIVVTIPIFVASNRWIWGTVTAFPAYGEFPWLSVAALLTIIVLALAFSLSQSRIQEFG
jgi:hypothetical protein